MEKNVSRWIWYTGDFEIYHSMLLHDRREEHGHDYPCMWHVSRPEYNVRFRKTVNLEKDTTFRPILRGKGYVILDGRFYPIGQSISISAGEHSIIIGAANTQTFPALFIDSPDILSDDTWESDRFDNNWKKADCNPVFALETDDPAIFPFAYKDLPIVAKEDIDGGVLYDFGAESYGPITIRHTAEMGNVFICYGESKEEALDAEYALIRETLSASEKNEVLRPRAFRYIYVKADQGQPEISAQLEYLPIQDIASFSCDDDKIKDIWKICAHTFHLNSREFYLDGIKRDRWVWSGDAYQSYMVNRYLYFDPAITKRTIRALFGKRPVLQHINTINDYSAYLIIAVWEYYFATGDKDFVSTVWEDVLGLYSYITTRLDAETGYVVQKPGDWIFIDWADIDKDGPLCAEQILLWQTYLVMAKLSAVLGIQDASYQKQADQLKTAILRDFWDDARGAFIDSYTSGRQHITRHANIFAILYDFVDAKTAERIAENVLHGTLADPITTPYFKFFELMALGKMEDMEGVQEYIDAYWGGMLELGATSVWEQFDPRKEGVQHLEMYGMKYGCSLCHAWGSGPIALLGQFCAGVTPTSVGYQTFDVAPQPGHYKQFTATVPVNGGTVTVSYDDGIVRAKATVPGGTLKYMGKALPISVDEESIISK